ncbi:MAG: phosphopantetheine-binding protein [Pseudomonadota bacterium]
MSLTPLQLEIASLMVSALNLEVQATDISPDEPLFYDGLGLDSIDALELALELTRNYGFELRAEDDQNQKIFASLRSLTEHVETHRSK